MGGDSDQLGNLMAYTVFHIGVYIALGTAVIGGGAITHIDHPVLRFSLLCMLVAGFCGGVIASWIPEYKAWNEFVDAKIGVWWARWFCYKQLAITEHAVFWAGVLAPAIMYLVKGAAPFVK